MKISRGIFIFALVALAPTPGCGAKQVPPPPPLSVPASAALAGPHSPIGTGLDAICYYSTEFPFLDVFKTSGEWMSGTADAWDDKRPLDLDAHGWVRSLRPGQRAITLMMLGPQMWIGGKYRVPAGRYTVEYEGEGTIEYDGARIVETAPGRDVIELTPEPGSGLALYVTAVNPRNYIRNIRVLLPGADPAASAGGETFNPVFLESLRGYQVIRFLGWMTGPSAEDIDAAPNVWSRRPRIMNARWDSVHGGPPIEVMVSLCNRLHVDPWISMHHLADDDFVRRFAETLCASLDTGLKVYIEHSNEVWNPSYTAPYNYASQRGLALGLSTDPDQARQRYNARRTREIGAIFRKVLGRTRVVVVLATQSEVPGISEEMLSWDGTAADVDALATAPYFGYELGLKENEPRVEKMSLDELFHELETKVIPEMNSSTEQQVAIARKYGVACISYEGGQHLVNLEGGSSAKVDALFDAANRDPRMGRIYTKYIEDWNRMTGGQLWMHLMNCGQAGNAGRWGVLEYLGQSRTEAPKYDAMRKWMESAP